MAVMGASFPKEEYGISLEEWDQADPSVPRPTPKEIFLDVVGGLNSRGCVPGLGSLSKKIPRSRSSSSSSQGFRASVDNNQQRELHEMRELLERVVTRMESIEEEFHRWMGFRRDHGPDGDDGAIGVH